MADCSKLNDYLHRGMLFKYFSFIKILFDKFGNILDIDQCFCKNIIRSRFWIVAPEQHHAACARVLGSHDY
jgi:hypothetical protein